MDFAIAYDAALGAHDIVLSGGGLVPDSTLGTAVGLSLFVDRRADLDQVEGDETFGQADPRGWFGDAFQAQAGDAYGSHLWLYQRAKLTPDTLGQIRSVFIESLQWLIDRGIAREVDVAVEKRATGRIDVSVTVWRQAETPVEYRYVWDALEGSVSG